MELNNKNGDWENEAPVLASVKKENPFTVPGDYFADLQGQIMSRISLERIKQDGSDFGVPEGYFEDLGERIRSSVKAEDLREQTGETGFTVPDQYFSRLQESIVSKTITVKKEKKIRRLIPSWVNYAAAACIAVVAGTVIFFNIHNNSLESKFSEIPEDEIVNYLQVHSDTGDFPVIIDNLGKSTAGLKQGSDLSDQEIEQYLETTL